MKLAVWGAGLIGRKHAQLVHQQNALAAIADPNPQIETMCQELGCAFYPTPQACLEAQDLDGVIIATPNQTHVQHLDLCLSCGLPVMIEKPIADKAVNAAPLVQLAEDQNVPILVAHHRRHNPISQRANQCISDGTLGQIRAISGHFLLHKPEDYFETEWRRQAGAGPIFINLIHDVDLLRFLIGEIRSVQAVQSSRARGFEVEDTAAVLIEFENGVLGTFVLSDAVSAPWSWEFTAGENPAYPHIPTDAYRIAGTHGSLSFPDLKLWSHVNTRSWWEPIEARQLNVETYDPLVAQIQHFMDVCRGATPIVSGRDGLRSLQVVEAIKRAADTGVAVSLEQ